MPILYCIKNIKGNALFLILIAVALFAALSYAVTQSGRGGASSERERAQIQAAELIQKVQAVHSAIQRAYLIEGYDQILLNKSAETSSGTCYRGGNAYSPCRRIGIFNEIFNLPVLDTSPYRVADPGDNNMWFWYSRPLSVNGAQIGSAAPDEFITVRWLSDEICREINRNLHGIATIPDLGYLTSTHGWARIAASATGNIAGLTTSATGDPIDTPLEPPLCARFTHNNYIHVFKRE